MDDENIISRPSVSYDDLWAKTLLETSELDVCISKVLKLVHHQIYINFLLYPSHLQNNGGRSDGSSSPDSIGSVETSISSHFGGMNYPSLFSSRPV